MKFDWDENKNRTNQKKHGISFYDAQEAFFDENRLLALDEKHSTKEEQRYFCFAKVGDKVMTVRFTIRENRIRIFGAGYWREGKKRYEEENKV